VTVSGNTAAAHGINTEGLRRRGFSAERIETIRRAYRTLYRSGLTLQQAIAALRERQGELERDAAGEAPAAALDLALLAGFLERVSRGIVR
jgi:UDP-N-acetylglucosamine acyltransferase